ncbi:MAG: glycosyltransferase family 9 protein, partial [Leptospiraceae bacterium]|nr:glycosyltransferase family 9 protein [Leptospiraceae bacterium]
ICVIRLDEIGDFVLFTPFLRALRRTFPNAEITLIVNPAVFGLAFSCSFVDRVEKFDPRRKGIFWPYLLPFRAFFFGRRHHCDFAINGRFDSDFRYAASWMIAGSNAPVRIGWSVRSGRHPALLDAGKDLLYTSVFRKPPVHELDKAVTLAVHAGCNIDGEEPIPGLDAAADVRSALTLNQDSSRRIRLMLFPGGSYANKKWSLERYVAVLRKLSQDFPLEILLIGGEGEKEDCHLVRQYLPDATDLCGKLSLQELYMTARDCDLYLGSDSGPAHVAAAAGTSTLVLFRSPATLSPEHQHSVQRFLPRGKGRIEYLQPERPIPPCKGSCEKDFPHCILQISEDMVLEKLKEMIEDLVAKKENL